MADEKQRGRPSKPTAERRRHNQTFRCNDAMLGQLRAAAEAGQRSVSEEVEARLEQSFRDADLAERVAEAVAKRLGRL